MSSPTSHTSQTLSDENRAMDSNVSVDNSKVDASIIAKYYEHSPEIGRIASMIHECRADDQDVLSVIQQVHGKSAWRTTINKGILQPILDVLMSEFHKPYYRVTKTVKVYRMCRKYSANDEEFMSQFHLPASATVCKEYFKRIMKSFNGTSCVFEITKGVPLILTLPWLIGENGNADEVEVLLPPLGKYFTYTIVRRDDYGVPLLIRVSRALVKPRSFSQMKSLVTRTTFSTSNREIHL